ACATPAGIWSSCGIVVERALDNPASFIALAPGRVGANGMACIRTRGGCSYKGGLASAVVGAPAPGCEGSFPERDDQLVRGGAGSSAPALDNPPPSLRWLLLLPGFGVGFGVARAHGLRASFHDQVGDQGDGRWQ